MYIENYDFTHLESVDAAGEIKKSADDSLGNTLHHNSLLIC